MAHWKWNSGAVNRSLYVLSEDLLFVSLFDLFDEIYDACTVAAALHATMPCFIAVRCITFHFVSHTRAFLVTMETRGGRRGSSRRIIRGNSLRIS